MGENAALVMAQLTDMAERGVKPGEKRLFVIEGFQALRAGKDAGGFGCGPGG